MESAVTRPQDTARLSALRFPRLMGIFIREVCGMEYPDAHTFETTEYVLQGLCDDKFEPGNICWHDFGFPQEDEYKAVQAWRNPLGHHVLYGPPQKYRVVIRITTTISAEMESSEALVAGLNT